MFPPKILETARCKIKLGAPIFQDHHFGEWPNCLPPEQEYRGEEYQCVAKNPDMEFDCEWNGKYWDCRADGYGRRGEYGNGSIFVTGYGAVEVVKGEQQR